MRKMKPIRRNQFLLIALICVALTGGGIVYYKTYYHPKETAKNNKIEKIIEETKKEDKKTHSKTNTPPSVIEPQIEMEDTETEKEKEIEENISESETDSATNENIDEKKPEETNEQQNTIYIPFTKSLLNRKDLSVDNLPSGKVYYNSLNGKIESSVSIKEGKLYEYLTSFDKDGNKIDQLEIGFMDEKSVTKTRATISKNNITTFTLVPDKKNQEEELVVVYMITQDLRFIKKSTYKKVL
jgi:hypothetical protein